MDIDIDTPSTFDPSKIFDKFVRASMVKNNELVKHPCGCYFQNIPVDPETNLAAIPYDQAEGLGYFKVDLLHLTALDHFASKEEIRTLLKLEPNWDLLLDENNLQKVGQISRQYAVVSQVRPRSVQELADCIALIRPGKRHLLPEYLKDRVEVRKQLYTPAEDGYYFKRSHAIAYALTIVLQLHLIALEVL